MTDVFQNALASPQFQAPDAGAGGVANALGVNPFANMQAAMAKMKLTPEEQALYLHHLANLQKGGVANADGTTSTLYQTSFGPPDQVTNAPTIYGNTKMQPDDAIERAYKMGIQNFPTYGSEFKAENRYQQMHNYMEKDIPDASNALRARR